MKKEDALRAISREHNRAITHFKPFNSAHEGFAVIKEEYDELWDEIKKRHSKRSNERMKEEATQLGAMALRFLIDIIK